MLDYCNLNPDTLSSEQRRIYQSIESGPRGLVAGPLLVWLHSPGLAQTAQALGAYCRFDSQLRPRLRELAIVTVGAHWNAAYEWISHAPLALAAGISAETLDSIRTGGVPDFGREDEAAVFEFCRELLLNHCVSRTVFDRAEQELGPAGLVDLTGILGYYTLICMTIRAFQVPIGTGVTDPFL